MPRARPKNDPTEPAVPAPTGWPASEVEHVAVTALIPYARNPRTHSDEQVAQLMGSIREWGFTTPILRDEAGMVIAGHGRLMAAQRLGLPEVPVVTARGWSDAKKRAYVIADNQLALNAGWDAELLALEVGELQGMDIDLDLLGFSEEELGSILDGSGEDEDGEGGDRKGSVLAALDVSIADPRHEVKPGQVWFLGERHTLLCVCVLTGWPIWREYLTEDAIFCPFPGPFVPLSMKAEDHSLILVQPNPYAAGHVLDRYADVHGEESVGLVEDE